MTWIPISHISVPRRAAVFNQKMETRKIVNEDGILELAVDEKQFVEYAKRNPIPSKNEQFFFFVHEKYFPISAIDDLLFQQGQLTSPNLYVVGKLMPLHVMFTDLVSDYFWDLEVYTDEFGMTNHWNICEHDTFPHIKMLTAKLFGYELKVEIKLKS